MPKVSIIANFYKSEKYIGKLINSILNQSYQDWELIAVNDCSPGKDIDILRKYELERRMNGRMKIIDNKVNQGISYAKRTGIEAASGEYLTFIDGDDWLEPLALEKMVAEMDKHNLDLVVCNYYRRFKGVYKKACKSNSITYDIIYDRGEIMKNVIRTFFGMNFYSSVGYWGKMFRRSTLSKSRFKPTKITASEDLFFNLEYLLVAERMKFIDYQAYNWRWGGLSSSSTNKEEASFSTINTVKNFNDFYFQKMKIIEKYNLPNCIRSLRIELYNVLREMLNKVCAPTPDSEEGKEARKVLIKALSLPAYKDILFLRRDAKTSITEEFFDAFENNDIDKLYSFYNNIFKRRWKRRLLVSVLSRIEAINIHKK